MDIQYKLNWELGNCGGDEIFCCEKNSEEEGTFLPSSSPCSAPQGDDPLSMSSTCSYQAGFPEAVKRNCALYDVLTTAVEVTQKAGGVKTKEQFWQSVKVNFDTLVDSKPRRLVDEDVDGQAKTWTYAKVAAASLKKQFTILHTIISQIAARREQELEENRGDGSGSDTDLSQAVVTPPTAFELRVLKAYDIAAKKPPPPPEKSSRSVAKLSEAEMTALTNSYMHQDGASSSATPVPRPSSSKKKSGVRSLRENALNKKPVESESNLQVKKARLNNNSTRDEAEDTRETKKSAELTNRVMEAYLAKQMPQENASSQLTLMKKYLDESKDFLSEEQCEQAVKKMKDTATEGFNKMFNN